MADSNNPKPPHKPAKIVGGVRQTESKSKPTNNNKGSDGNTGALVNLGQSASQTSVVADVSPIIEEKQPPKNSKVAQVQNQKPSNSPKQQAKSHLKQNNMPINQPR